jgi:hypothetical protein
MLSGTLLRALGVPVTGQRPFVLANGQRITRDVGQAWVRIDGREVMTIVVFGETPAPRSSARSRSKSSASASTRPANG